LTYPSEKYKFVSWNDDIPNIWKNKIHVPNHQPAIHIPWEFSTSWFCSYIPMIFPLSLDKQRNRLFPVDTTWFHIKRSSTGVPMPHRCDSTSHSGPVPCRWSGRVCHTCHHSVSGRGLKVLRWKRGFVQWLVTGGNHLQKMDYQAATNYLTNFTANLSMVYHHLFPFFDA
jgi:hypothetical protein